jgi:hypothetical protein
MTAPGLERLGPCYVRESKPLPREFVCPENELPAYSSRDVLVDFRVHSVAGVDFVSAVERPAYVHLKRSKRPRMSKSLLTFKREIEEAEVSGKIKNAAVGRIGMFQVLKAVASLDVVRSQRDGARGFRWEYFSLE